MIPILNSSAGRVNGIGSEGRFERLNTSIFFLVEFEFEFDSCTTVCAYVGL